MMLLAIPSSAQTRAAHVQPPTPEQLADSKRQSHYQEIIDAAVGNALRVFSTKKLTGDEVSATLIDLRDPEHHVRAEYRGEAPMYPASVIKLFYLVAVQQQMEDKKIEDTAELRRAMHDMVVDSLNEATGYVVDVLTDTTSGPELPPTEIEQWHTKRDAVNRYYTSLGYTNINVNKKPWCEGPYGRETQAAKLFKPSRNQLTTDATARLMAEIATGKAVSPARCEQMKELLYRDFADTNNHNYQVRTFSSTSLPKGAKLWSKAGWTNENRHDAAYVELPNGERFVLVVFTANHANEHEIIPTIARLVVERMMSDK